MGLASSSSYLAGPYISTVQAPWFAYAVLCTRAVDMQPWCAALGSNRQNRKNGTLIRQNIAFLAYINISNTFLCCGTACHGQQMSTTNDSGCTPPIVNLAKELAGQHQLQIECKYQFCIFYTSGQPHACTRTYFSGQLHDVKLCIRIVPMSPSPAGSSTVNILHIKPVIECALVDMQECDVEEPLARRAT